MKQTPRVSTGDVRNGREMLARMKGKWMLYCTSWPVIVREGF